MRIKRRTVLIPAITVVLLIGAWPLTRIVVPAVQLQVLSEEGEPAAGVVVKEEWRDWSAEFQEHKEISHTDLTGHISFPQRTVRSCRLFVVGLASWQLITGGVHASVGPSAWIWAHGQDPHVWTFVQYRKGTTLPATIRLKAMGTAIWP
jgi:hypothetical protein